MFTTTIEIRGKPGTDNDKVWNQKPIDSSQKFEEFYDTVELLIFFFSIFGCGMQSLTGNFNSQMRV